MVWQPLNEQAPKLAGLIAVATRVQFADATFNLLFEGQVIFFRFYVALEFGMRMAAMSVFHF